MEIYGIVKFLHIVGVLILFAATGIEIAIMLGLRSASTAGQVRTIMRLGAPLHTMHPAATLTITLSGLLMVATTWGWTTAWINVSLVAMVVVSVLAPRIVGPRFGAIGRTAAMAGDGPVSPALRQHMDNPVLLSAVSTLTATGLGFVYLMTVKPGLIGALTTLPVAIVVGLAVAQVLRRRSAPAGQPVVAPQAPAGSAQPGGTAAL